MNGHMPTFGVLFGLSALLSFSLILWCLAISMWNTGLMVLGTLVYLAGLISFTGWLYLIIRLLAYVL